MGIRGRLLALAVGAAVPLALLGVLDLRRGWEAEREHLDQSVRQQADLAAVAFERWIDAQQQPLIIVAAALGADPPTQPSNLERGLGLILSTRPHWLDARVLDADGSVVAVHPADSPPLSPWLAEWLRAELGARRAPVVGTDWTSGTEQRVLAVAAPVEGGSSVTARLRAEAVNDIFRDITLHERAMLTVLDPQGRIVYRSRSMDAYVGTDVSGSSLFTALDRQRTAVLEVESPVDQRDKVYGVARAGATGYIITVGVPSATLYEPARRQLMRYLGLSLLALFCTSLAALVIARGVLRPLVRLREAARSFGRGDLSARAPGEGSHEIAEVSGAFNAMAASIEEREARLSELDRLKSEFVSGVSHELRTPLTTIKTLTGVMLRDGVGDSERRRYLKTIAAQCDRQIDLVLNLLDLSRIESGALSLDPAPVNAAEVIDSSLKVERPAAELRGHELRAALPSELPRLAADRGALRRVLCSLVENAIKYTPDGGRIVVEARASGAEVAISVSDNGRGITPHDLPHVFEKFYRGRPPAESAGDGAREAPDESEGDFNEQPGVGLGLYLARNLVEQMGGRIAVESAGGRGSTFTVRLPACDRMANVEVSPGVKGGHGGKATAG